MEADRDELEAAAIEAELASLDEALDSMATADDETDWAASDDIRRALDNLRVAERVAELSEAVARAGITDVLEGAEMLAASEDSAVQSAIVGLIAEEDLAESMDIAAISGQLFAVSELLDAVDMPVLAAFLEAKGEELHDIAVDNIFRYSAARALGESKEIAGAGSDDLGEQEPAEDVVDDATAESLAEQELAEDVVDEAAAESLAEQELAEDVVEEVMAESLAESDDEPAAATPARGRDELAADSVAQLAAELEELLSQERQQESDN